MTGFAVEQSLRPTKFDVALLKNSGSNFQKGPFTKKVDSGKFGVSHLISNSLPNGNGRTKVKAMSRGKTGDQRTDSGSEFDLRLPG